MKGTENMRHTSRTQELQRGFLRKALGMNSLRLRPVASNYLAPDLFPCYNISSEAGRKFAMKTKSLALQLACSIVFTLSAITALSQTVITFDDLPSSLGGAPIPTTYQALTWSNFFVVNAVLDSNFFGYVTGANYGMVSASNVAFNGGGSPAEIDSSVTNFNFLSAYLTGAWNSNLNIEVEGFNGAQKIYDTIVVASATNATLFTFDYFNIDRLYFDSYGGQVAFGPSPEYNFVMDNFMFEFIPEPSSLLLTCVGAVSLLAFLRRKPNSGREFPGGEQSEQGTAQGESVNNKYPGRVAP